MTEGPPVTIEGAAEQQPETYTPIFDNWGEVFFQGSSGELYIFKAKGMETRVATEYDTVPMGTQFGKSIAGALECDTTQKAFAYTMKIDLQRDLEDYERIIQNSEGIFKPETIASSQALVEPTKKALAAIEEFDHDPRDKNFIAARKAYEVLHGE